MHPRFAAFALLAIAPTAGVAQQEADTTFAPLIETPAWPAGGGPVVAIDEGHANFHTTAGRYRPFAEVLRRDGYVVRPTAGRIAGRALDGVQVLVVANALGEVREGEDTSASAFTPEEIARLRGWVRAAAHCSSSPTTCPSPAPPARSPRHSASSSATASPSE